MMAADLRQEKRDVSNSTRRSDGHSKFAKKHADTHPSSQSRQKERQCVANQIASFDDSVAIKSFEDIPLSAATRRALAEQKFTEPSEIQKRCIVPALKGFDLLASSETGSGKTLAFLIPIIENLWTQSWSIEDGIGALILSPTRELAIQLFETLSGLSKYHMLNVSLIIGGQANIENEVRMIGRANILIATPGRLLQHMDETPSFQLTGLQILTLDEADRILDSGFKRAVDAILENLPQERQTLLFSATQTKSIKDLARVNCNDPKVVNLVKDQEYSLPAKMNQLYTVCNQHDKLNFLWSFIKAHLYHRTIVFFSSCKQVSFFYEVFRILKPGVPLLSIHGNMKQAKREENYKNFIDHTRAVLFSTDLVSRGLDFPDVHWVLQLDCPEDLETYIHRSGRTARYNSAGNSLTLFIEHELDIMLDILEKGKIKLKEIKMNTQKYRNIEPLVKKLCEDNDEIRSGAKRALMGYMKFQIFRKNSKLFDYSRIDLEKFAHSLGLEKAPKIRAISRRQKTTNNPQTMN